MADRYDEMAYKISGSDGILQRDIAAALRQAVAAERKANCKLPPPEGGSFSLGG